MARMSAAACRSSRLWDRLSVGAPWDDDTRFEGEDDCLDPIANTQLGPDVSDVCLDRRS